MTCKTKLQSDSCFIIREAVTHPDTYTCTEWNQTNTLHINILYILRLKKTYRAGNGLPTHRDEVYYHDSRYVGLSREEEASTVLRKRGANFSLSGVIMSLSFSYPARLALETIQALTREAKHRRNTTAFIIRQSK